MVEAHDQGGRAGYLMIRSFVFGGAVLALLGLLVITVLAFAPEILHFAMAVGGAGDGLPSGVGGGLLIGAVVGIVVCVAYVVGRVHGADY